jgi:hypothetical protein
MSSCWEIFAEICDNSVEDIRLMSLGIDGRGFHQLNLGQLKKIIKHFKKVAILK